MRRKTISGRSDASPMRFSTMACVPVSLSQEVGMALGAQAGQAKLTDVIKAGGFSHQVLRAAETPQNMILEARQLSQFSETPQPPQCPVKHV